MYLLRYFSYLTSPKFINFVDFGGEENPNQKGAVWVDHIGSSSVWFTFALRITSKRELTADSPLVLCSDSGCDKILSRKSMGRKQISFLLFSRLRA